MVTIKKVESKKELKRFIRFNYELYKNNKYSVPDLYEDMLDTFSDKNPAMEFCEAVYFLAYKDGRLAGRIAGIINHKANATWKVKNVRFGWMDFVDDEEVSKALVEAVEQWGREKGMTKMQGPLGFTDLDAEGMLIEGFDELSTMATLYNYPYYQTHMEKLGFEKDADWIEIQIDVPHEVPERMSRIAEIVRKKYNLSIKKYTSRKKVRQDYGNEIFHVVNEAYKSLFGFSEMTQKQIDKYISVYLSLLDPRMISLITEESGRLVGVGVAMPSLSEALQKAKGKLLPFGWFYLLRNLTWKKPKIVDLLLVGVLPEYQNKGVNSLLFCDLIPIVSAAGYEKVETNPELEVNSKVQQQWIYFKTRQHKRRRCFKKTL